MMAALLAIMAWLVLASSAAADIRLAWSPPRAVDQPRPYVNPVAIDGISCASVSLCVAVDGNGDALHSTDPGASSPSWPVTRLARAPGEGLAAVSCPSLRLCVAVDAMGRIRTTTDPTGGAAAWRGAPKSIAAIYPSGISCPSASFCAALAGRAILTSANPTGGAAAWKVARILPSGSAELTALSCPSRSLCVAVTSGGSVAVSTDPTAGARTWKVHRVARCRASYDQRVGPICTYPAFNAVAYPSAGFCVAVDQFGEAAISTNPGQGAWIVVNVTSVGYVPPYPGLLTAIACPSAALCIATGSGGVFTTADAAGGAGAWTPTTIAGAHPVAVSCPSLNLCVTVGSLGETAASSDPASGAPAWTVTPVDGGDALEGVSCPTTRLCVALDDGGRALISHQPDRPGASWIATPAGLAPSAQQLPSDAPTMAAISCPASTLCVAVEGGQIAAATGDLHTWTVTPYRGAGTLRSVSCPSVSLCVAVDDGGEIITSTDPGRPRTWRRSHLSAQISLDSVSCPAPRLCVAAGIDPGRNPPLSNNRVDLLVSTHPGDRKSAWKLVRPRGVIAISSVTCPSAQFCVAATDNGLLTSTYPATHERAWRLRPLNNSQDITSLTCPSKSLCVATNLAGSGISYGDPSSQARWPQATIGNYDPVNAAACPSQKVCVAVDGNGSVSIGRPHE